MWMMLFRLWRMVVALERAQSRRCDETLGGGSFGVTVTVTVKIHHSPSKKNQPVGQQTANEFTLLAVIRLVMIYDATINWILVLGPTSL